MVSVLEEPHCCLMEEGWGRTVIGNLDHNPGGNTLQRKAQELWPSLNKGEKSGCSEFRILNSWPDKCRQHLALGGRQCAEAQMSKAMEREVSLQRMHLWVKERWGRMGRTLGSFLQCF